MEILKANLDEEKVIRTENRLVNVVLIIIAIIVISIIVIIMVNL